VRPLERDLAGLEERRRGRRCAGPPRHFARPGDGDAVVRSRRITRRTSRTTRGARPSEGSSRRSSRGCAIRARPIASICCSPPERVPQAARPAPGAGGTGAAPPRSAIAVGIAEPAQHQVLVHGHVGEDLAALRHEHDRMDDAAPRRLARRVAAADVDLAAPRRQQPAMAFKSVLLPAPLAPIRATISPSATCRLTP